MSGPAGAEPGAVARAIQDLRTSGLEVGELRSAVQAVVDATSTVFGADGGGVMLLDDQQALHYVGATDGRAAAMEAAQEETGEGPCVDSLVNDETVSTEDLREDPRWPELRRQIGELGVRAILGVPLHVGPTAVGSLNVYRFTPGPWSPGDVEAIAAFGRVVEELLATAMLAEERHVIVEQLTSALQNRVLIERAVGFVMATLDLDPVRAFDALRRSARARRIRVADLAAEVVEARSFDPATGPSVP
ncbi:MAG: GAF and ANTAR domain-containing protein [Acidimicrobiales bacterium]